MPPVAIGDSGTVPKNSKRCADKSRNNEYQVQVQYLLHNIIQCQCTGYTERVTPRHAHWIFDYFFEQPIKMEKETIISRFKERRSQHNIAFDLKNEQIEIAASVAKKRNCVGFLPTGFRKTFSFVLNAMVSDNSGLTLIISPLLSLMENQMGALRDWNFSCAKISADTSEDMLNGMYANIIEIASIKKNLYF